jgi:hypothetical protein
MRGWSSPHSTAPGGALGRSRARGPHTHWRAATGCRAGRVPHGSGDPTDTASGVGADKCGSAVPQPDRVVPGQRVRADVACGVDVSSLVERSLGLGTGELISSAGHGGECGDGHATTPDSAGRRKWVQRRIRHPVGAVHEEDRPLGRYAFLEVHGQDVADLGARSRTSGPQRKVRIRRCAALEGQDVRIPDHPVADLDRPANGVVRLPGVAAGHDGAQEGEERLADLPGR